MVNLSGTPLFLIQFIFWETTIECHLISENALRLKFIQKKQNQSCLRGTGNIREILPIAISELKSYLVEKINIKKMMVNDTVLSYDSLLIRFNMEYIRGLELKGLIEKHIKDMSTLSQKDQHINIINAEKHLPTHKKVIRVPAYYGIEVGWDLEALSVEKKLSISEIVSIHSEKLYTVCAIGFSPGFAYMGFVPPAIQQKRLSNPRTQVLPGSIAIAEDQTGIYPNISPGGWNIIGRTPSKMINLENTKKPSLFSIGDTVRFDPIDKKTYLALGGEINLP